ncbi:MAG: CvpA family protein [Patescibacteria group bacterium]|jgi:membrane protein required for colicin V production
MIFTLADVILIIIILIFVMWGFVMGLIRTIGALVGMIFGTWVAGRYFMPVADWLTPVLMGHAIAAKIIAFLFVFAAVNRLTVLLFYLIDRGFKLISIIPFLGSLNRLGGALLGLVEGVLTSGIIIFVLAKIAPDISLIKDSLANSQVAYWLVLSATWLTKLLPEAFNRIQSIF